MPVETGKASIPPPMHVPATKKIADNKLPLCGAVV